jgi:hypothetical protein
VTENGEPRFEVILSASVSQEIKRLARRADDLGIRASFVAALGVIHERLRRNPLNFGEYCFEWKNLNLWSYLGAIRPAAVQYAVRQQPPIVFVTKVTLMGS